MTDQRLCPVSVCQCLIKVSKMKSLVRSLAVPSILGFAKSILWSEFSKIRNEAAKNLLAQLNKHNPGFEKCKNAHVTNHLYENFDHKIDFAKPKMHGTARNRTKLFVLETLSINKLKPDINVDQSLITLYLFNM